MIPSDALLQEAIDRVIPLGFLSGTDTAIALAGMEIAWDLAERSIGSNILATGTDCEIHARPTGWVDYDEALRLLQLNKTHLQSIETVTFTHDEFTCACDEEDVTGCAVIYHDTYSQIRVEGSCTGPESCTCNANGRPVKVEVCYTAGRWGTVAAIPRAVIIALGMAAQWWADVMETGGAQASTGFVDQWKSMDYSESYGFIKANIMGTSPQLAGAWHLLRRYRVLRGVAMRSYYPSQGR